MFIYFDFHIFTFKKIWIDFCVEDDKGMQFDYFYIVNQF